MDAVVLTFPGHLLQTQLCLRSIDQHYPEITDKYLFYDDLAIQHWPDFLQDLSAILQENKIAVRETVPFSSLTGIDKCEVGWWRQQLVKLCLDLMLPQSNWFVIDGDVIFEQHINIVDAIPVSLQSKPGVLTELTFNYVKGLLGIEWQGFRHSDQFAMTNPVPFRWLDKTTLQGLRWHVESIYQKDFVSLHCDWFKDQTILAFEDPPRRMSMSEWELIEAFRDQILLHRRPTVDIGSGYPLDVPSKNLTEANNVFRHGYLRDAQMPLEWYASRGLRVNDDIWQRSCQWLLKQENDPYV